jgi:site-specific DNA recombinase
MWRPYCRISREEEVASSDDAIGSIARQKERLIAAAEMAGEEYKVYVDDGKSGTTLDGREGLRQLRADLRRGDTVAVYRIDRLARRNKDTAILLEDFEEKGVDFFSVTEGISTQNISGRFMVQLMGIMAEQEARYIVERMRAGRLNRWERGYWSGANPPYGYDVVELENGLRQLVPNEDAKIVRKIFQWALQGEGTFRITKWLNQEAIPCSSGSLWDKSSVGYLIINPVYTGRKAWQRKPIKKKKQAWQPKEKWKIGDQSHPPIVTDDEFEMVQQLLQERSFMPGRIHRSPYLLTGVIRCPRCGRHLFGRTVTSFAGKAKNKHVYRYYECPGNSKKGICDQLYTRADKVEPVVIERIKEFVLRVDSQEYLTQKVLEKDEFRGEIEEKIIRIKTKIEDLQKRKKRWMDSYEDGVIYSDDLKNRLTSINHEADIFEGKLEELEKKKRKVLFRELNIQRVSELCQDFEGIFESATPDQRKRIIRQFIHSVIYNSDGTIEIAFNF